MMRWLPVLLAFTVLLPGCSDFWYGRTLEGEVVQQPGQRFTATETGAQEKFSVKIKSFTSDAKIDDVAKGPSGTIIECLSTRCGSINMGECHRFECSYEYHFGEPDVIACKHTKEIECPASTSD